MSKIPLNDDGELPFETDVEKPKKRPPSRWWQKTYVPIPLLLALCLLLICSAVLLLSSSFANEPLLCKIPSFCSDRTAAEILALVGRDPRPPLNTARIKTYSIVDPQTNNYTNMNVTVTPAQYLAPRCDPDADYHNSLMFTMEEGDNTEIFTINADGNALCRVTHNLIDEHDVDWSPDRKHIVFSSQRSGDPASDIYEMNFDGTNIVNLTQDRRNDSVPVWSPDGTQIAFSSHDQEGLGAQIYVVNADGSNRRNLTPGAIGAWMPIWSPDGTQIAYTAQTEAIRDRSKFYTVAVSSGQIREIVSNVMNDSSDLAWSPDGLVLFVRANVYSDEGKYQNVGVYTLSLANQQWQPFAPITAMAFGITFSPDKAFIAYVMEFSLYILDLNTMQARSLPTDHMIDSRVSWR